MCCNLQTHTIIISSLCLLLTGFSSGYSGPRIIHQLKSPTQKSLLIWNLFAVISEIMSIVGASRKNRRPLIPFIITLVLEILACFGILVFYYGTINYHMDGYEIGGLYIGIAMRIYFLMVVVQFYRYCALARGITPVVA